MSEGINIIITETRTRTCRATKPRRPRACLLIQRQTLIRRCCLVQSDHGRTSTQRSSKQSSARLPPLRPEPRCRSSAGRKQSQEVAEALTPEKTSRGASSPFSENSDAAPQRRRRESVSDGSTTHRCIGEHCARPSAEAALASRSAGPQPPTATTEAQGTPRKRLERPAAFGSHKLAEEARRATSTS